MSLYTRASHPRAVHFVMEPTPPAHGMYGRTNHDPGPADLITPRPHIVALPEVSPVLHGTAALPSSPSPAPSWSTASPPPSPPPSPKTQFLSPFPYLWDVREHPTTQQWLPMLSSDDAFTHGLDACKLYFSPPDTPNEAWHDSIRSPSEGTPLTVQDIIFAVFRNMNEAVDVAEFGTNGETAPFQRAQGRCGSPFEQLKNLHFFEADRLFFKGLKPAGMEDGVECWTVVVDSQAQAWEP